MSHAPFVAAIAGLAGSGRRSVGRKLADNLGGILLDASDIHYALAYQFVCFRAGLTTSNDSSDKQFMDWVKAHAYFTIKNGEVMEVCSFPIVCENLHTLEYRVHLNRLLNMHEFSLWVYDFLASTAGSTNSPVVLLQHNLKNSPPLGDTPLFFLYAAEQQRAERLGVQRANLREREGSDFEPFMQPDFMVTTNRTVDEVALMIQDQLS